MRSIEPNISWTWVNWAQFGISVNSIEGIELDDLGCQNIENYWYWLLEISFMIEIYWSWKFFGDFSIKGQWNIIPFTWLMSTVLAQFLGLICKMSSLPVRIFIGAGLYLAASLIKQDSSVLNDKHFSWILGDVLKLEITCFN